jgi:hypothetical protein
VDWSLGASRPLGSWGTEYPGGVPDEVWLNEVPVDWSWLKANGFTTSTDPNSPTTESGVVLHGAMGSQQIGNTVDSSKQGYICEYA